MIVLLRKGIHFSIAGRRGGDLVQTMHGCVYPKVTSTWVLFKLQVSEISENISFKMGVESAASLNMNEN